MHFNFSEGGAIGFGVFDAVPNITVVKAGTTITLELFSTDRNYYARYMDGVFSGGSGTEADPFQISTIDDLDELATKVSNGYDFKDFYFILTADLDFSGISFTPIGNDSYVFDGNFDGQGHTIKGISIANENNYQGLFGYVSTSGVIQNLTLDDSSIKGGSQSGGIAGRSNGTIKNCHVTGSVTIQGYSSKSYLGGITGYSKGIVSGCTSTASVGSSNLKSCYYVTADALPNAAGGSSSSKDKANAKKGYTVSSGTDGLTLSYGETTADYDYDGVKDYSFGLLYADKLYAASGASVNFNANAPDGKKAVNVTASAGTLVANEDESYTLVMTSSDAVITAELEEVSLVSFTDGVDNTIVLAAFDGERVGVEYDRELTTGENGESTAFTVCIPYDYDAEEYTLPSLPLTRRSSSSSSPMLRPSCPPVRPSSS